MAILVETETNIGGTAKCYIRLNNVEASNHGYPARALFRGFMSKEAFKAGKHYVFEREVEFQADVSRPLWEQAYEALKTQPLIEVPDEPAAPASPPPPPEQPEGVEEDGPEMQRWKDAMERYEADLKQRQGEVEAHALAMKEWEAECEAIEQRNLETIALSEAEAA